MEKDCIICQFLDGFDVRAENFLFNIEADRLYCILNAPNKESIESHHKKYGVICEWIMEKN
jgi:hypothetical protein